MPGRSPQFQTLAPSYNRLRPQDANWYELADSVFDTLQLPPNGKLLEVGCGTGRFAAHAVSRGAQVTGIDPAPAMIEQARETAPQAVFKVATAEDLVPGSYDGASMMMVSHLLDDRARAFAKIGSAVRPGGRVAIVTLAPEDFEHYWLGEFFPFYSAIEASRFGALEQLAEELEQAGFSGPAVDTVAQSETITRDEALTRIRHRNFSTLHLLDLEEFVAGVARAEEQLPDVVTIETPFRLLSARR